MIKISRTAAPKSLTPALIRSLTDKFKIDGTSVWNKTAIKKALLEMSKNKCCYCESNITQESNYLEVDHFFPKEHFPNLVVEWSNLLPSCKRCNVKKGRHNTFVSPIINPSVDDPREHLQLKAYRMKEKNGSALGRETIHVLKLNDHSRVVTKRFEVGNRVEERFDEIMIKVRACASFPIGEDRNKLTREISHNIEGLLEVGLPDATYSATIATVLQGSTVYNDIKIFLNQEGMWTTDLQKLESKVLNLSLL